MLYLLPRDYSGLDEYKSCLSVSTLFSVYSQGLMTANDSCVMFSSIQKASELDQSLVKQTNLDNAIRLFNGKKMPKNWNLQNAIDDLKRGYTIEPIAYRPFDITYSPYTGRSCGWHWRPRTETMVHLSNERENVCLILTRIVQKGSKYNHAFVAKHISDKGMLSSKDNAFVFPLYTYSDIIGGTLRQSNIRFEELSRFAKNLSLPINEEISQKDMSCLSSYDVFCYCYAVLYSERYRGKYGNLLILDFPCIPFPTNLDSFWRMVTYGHNLICLHTDELVLDSSAVQYDGRCNIVIETVEHSDRAVVINKNNCFSIVPQALWDYTIGSYQPLQKWLKDRKGQILTPSDIEHYKQIIQSLIETQRIMKEINEVSEL